ncbi:MAG: S8 family serine peptidase [Natronomonas sp.]
MQFRRLLAGVLCVFLFCTVLAGLSTFGAVAEAGGDATTLEDGTLNATTADAATEATTDRSQATQPRVSERVPFGVRATYGQNDLQEPRGGDGVSVAVLDTGVDRSHPDLRGQVTLCRDFTGETVRNECTDANGHGTHVAGTIAAQGGTDDRGIYGVAPDAELYAFKVCDDEGQCSGSALREAIRTAADEGADIVVLSLGGQAEPRVLEAVEYATQRDVAVIAAAGNSGPDIDTIQYPAADRRTIAVGAVGALSGEFVAPNNYGVAEFSSRGVRGPYSDGDRHVDVSGYGVGVLSPVPGGYARLSGTSMAAPHVAGLSARILARNPGMTPPELKETLHTRASRIDVTEGRHAGPGYDPAAGFGFPTVEEPVAAFETRPQVPIAGESFVLDGTPSRSDARIVEYRWDTTGDGTIDRRGERIELTRPAGDHEIRLRIVDEDGGVAETTRRIGVRTAPSLSVEAPSFVRAGDDVELRAVVDDGVTVRWEFPDATFSGDRVVYRFPSGETPITVRATGPDGAETTRQLTIEARAGSIPDQGLTVPPVLVALLVAGIAAYARRRY